MTDQNPYGYTPTMTEPPAPSGPQEALRRMRGPAIGLIVTSVAFLILISLGLCLNVVFLVTGVAEEMGRLEIEGPTVIMIRLLTGVVLMALNGLVLFGAIKMLSLKSHGWAKTAAVIACIPCLSPCYIFGIPFGIWALVVMADPAVMRAFRE